MIPSRLIRPALIIANKGGQSIVTNLKPLCAANPLNHTQLWQGILRSNQAAPKAVVAKQLLPNHIQTHLANLQQELQALVHCQSLAIEATSQVSGIPTVYASNLSPDTGIFEANSLHQCPTSCIVMSYHPGQTLKRLIHPPHQCSPLTFRQKITIFLTICKLVNRLHQCGVMHLDLKPSNFIVKDNFELVLIDFGLSQHIQNHALTVNAGNGQTAGTPAYMSPEQFTGQPLDHRSDLYSLGIVLYELLAGYIPFQANNLYGWAIAHCQTPVPYLTPNSQLSSFACQACQPLIDQLLAKHIDNRSANLDHIIHALQILLDQ